MADPKENEIRLKVGELTAQEEVGKGIIRIGLGIISKLGIKEGDVVEIEGGKKTAGIAIRSYPADVGLNIVRMDGIMRRNSNSGVGEFVKIRKTEVKEARKVVISPAERGMNIFMSPELFKQNIYNRAMTKGDIIIPSPGVKRNEPGSDIFSNFFGFDIGDFFGEAEVFTPFSGETRFVVIDTDPKGIVRIGDVTELQVLPELPEDMKQEEKVVPTVTYEDIGGIREIVHKVREMIEIPLRHPELFERLGIEPPKGVMLYGPPGTGKTLLANFISLSGPEVMSKWYGQSEENLRKIFEEAEKNAPSIIFIDEIDAIAPKREEVTGEVERRVVSQLLTLMDGLKKRGKVVVIAATNRPNAVDSALRRGGRFDREIELPVPDRNGRLEILKIHTRRMPIKGTIYLDIVARKFSEHIEAYLKENNMEKEKIENKIKYLKEKSERNELIDRLTFIKSRISKLERIKTLIESKEKLELLARWLVDIYHTIEVREESDPREPLIEKTKSNAEENVSEIIDEIKSLDLLEKNIWNINSSFWNSMRTAGVERDIENLADITYGYVGADIWALAKEAAMSSLRRVLPEIKWREEKELPKEIIEKLIVKKSDFESALHMVEPSAMREVLVEIPKVKWSDIGGLEDVKKTLNEMIEWPLKNPECFDRMGITPPKGILLYGPPGCGKTLLAKAVANESGANFISIKGPEVLTMWVGESEKKIRELFRRARQVAPCIIMLDEIDALAPRRGAYSGTRVSETVVSQLLTEMSGLEDLKGVVVIAATNRPDIIDPALLRPGRIDRFVLIPSPDEQARLEIFKVHTKNMPIKDLNLKDLAKRTDGFSGADIEAICREAAMSALREDMKAKEVKRKHFEEALKKAIPSLTREVQAHYEKFVERQKRIKKSEEERPEPGYIG